MDNTFVWTDDLVKEYIKYLQQGEGCGKWHPMEEFKKSKEVNKVLFVTEDNVPVYEGDYYYCVNRDFNHYGRSNGLGWYHPESGEKYFSTKEKADEYILMNKPLLSLNDILNNWDADSKYRVNPVAYSDAPIFLNLKKVAKQKLNQ